MHNAALNIEGRNSGSVQDANEIPIVYTDSDDETDAMKKKISFLELEQILEGKYLVTSIFLKPLRCIPI